MTRFLSKDVWRFMNVTFNSITSYKKKKKLVYYIKAGNNIYNNENSHITIYNTVPLLHPLPQMSTTTTTSSNEGYYPDPTKLRNDVIKAFPSFKDDILADINNRLTVSSSNTLRDSIINYFDSCIEYTTKVIIILLLLYTIIVITILGWW